MNISLSYNWLKEYVKINKSAKDFAKVFSLHSMTVDRVHENQPRWKNVLTVKILSIEKHPNADKLRLATVDTGKEKVRVVCGAPNIEAGQMVPFVREGGEVIGPDGKNFIVKKVNIRGVESSGMLCSKRELGLGDDHTGIHQLSSDTKIGIPLEKILPENDAVLDIEVTSNRPDCMSVIGIAREAAAILGINLNIKKSELKNIAFFHDREKKQYKRSGEVLDLKVMVDDKKLCPRYQAVVMADVKVGPSPIWMQSRLITSGIRPINNVVDITNYVMLEYGQPMHVFDAKKLFGYELATNNKRIGYEYLINVRLAKDGEKIVALDGKPYTLSNQDLVIADSEKPIAIAGIMGGEYSSADKNSNTIVFESANFHPVSVRKTSRRLRLMSESSNLFEKGLSPEGTMPAILRAILLTEEIAQGRVVSKIFDTYNKKYVPKKIKIHIKEVEQYLGVAIKAQEIKRNLQALGFGVAGGAALTVLVPWWRSNDIAIPEDIIEEIARIYGYHKLPTILPSGDIPQVSDDKAAYFVDEYKDTLLQIGFSEIYSYSMVSKKSLERLFISSQGCLKISNPLNEDLEYMRPSLLFGIFDAISFNQENFEAMKIFELSRVYLPKENDLPDERHRLVGALSGEKDLFPKIKGVVEFLFKKYNISGVKYFSKNSEETSVWGSGEFQDILHGEKTLGRFGLINKKVLHSFGIKKDVAIFNLNFSYVSTISSMAKTYTPPPVFPQIIRDLALVIKPEAIWKDLEGYISQFHPLMREVKYLSTYVGKDLNGKKCLALRIVFQSDQKTLKSGEVDDIMKQLVVKLGGRFGARLR